MCSLCRPLFGLSVRRWVLPPVSLLTRRLSNSYVIMELHRQVTFVAVYNSDNTFASGVRMPVVELAHVVYHHEYHRKLPCCAVLCSVAYFAVLAGVDGVKQYCNQTETHLPCSWELYHIGRPQTTSGDLTTIRERYFLHIN